MKNTKIELELGYKIMPSAFEAGFPPYMWILPKGNKGHNMWESYVKFTPKFRQVLVKKKKHRLKDKIKEKLEHFIIKFDDEGNIIEESIKRKKFKND